MIELGFNLRQERRRNSVDSFRSHYIVSKEQQASSLKKTSNKNWNVINETYLLSFFVSFLDDWAKLSFRGVAAALDCL